MQPIFLYGIMIYFSGEDPNEFKAQLYAAGLIASSLLTVMSGHPYLLGQMHLGMKMRIALCSLMYRKSLRLSRTALSDTSVGQVVNLLSNDVGRFDGILLIVHFIWLAPLELIVVTYFMYEKVNRIMQIIGRLII